MLGCPCLGRYQEIVRPASRPTAALDDYRASETAPTWRPLPSRFRARWLGHRGYLMPDDRLAQIEAKDFQGDLSSREANAAVSCVSTACQPDAPTGIVCTGEARLRFAKRSSVHRWGETPPSRPMRASPRVSGSRAYRATPGKSHQDQAEPRCVPVAPLLCTKMRRSTVRPSPTHLTARAQGKRVDARANHPLEG
jgi:hypothetical protein